MDTPGHAVIQNGVWVTRFRIFNNRTNIETIIDIPNGASNGFDTCAGCVPVGTAWGRWARRRWARRECRFRARRRRAQRDRSWDWTFLHPRSRFCWFRRHGTSGSGAPRESRVLPTGCCPRRGRSWIRAVSQPRRFWLRSLWTPLRWLFGFRARMPLLLVLPLYFLRLELRGVPRPTGATRSFTHPLIRPFKPLCLSRRGLPLAHGWWRWTAA